MKKILISLLMFCAVASTMFAAKASAGYSVVKQKDGTTLTVRLFGDENFSWCQTKDGVILYQEGTDYYVAKVNENGSIAPTAMLAHEASVRKFEERQLVAAQEKTRFYNYATAELRRAVARREPIATKSVVFPHMGKPRVLVILADFADQPFAHDDETTTLIFNQYLNADGVPTTGIEQIDKTERLSMNKGSVKKYFSDMSNGMFEPQFDVYGPVHLTQNMKYYGEGQSDWMSRFIPDVCKAMDESIDFSQYDADGDGIVDLVYVIYAGYSASINGNSSDCIWPKTGLWTNYGTYDGVTVKPYGVNSELNYAPIDTEEDGHISINGIGLFCHEFSHTMGLPDFYPTVASAGVDNQGMEDFSVMDGGEYCFNLGYCPAAYTAWEREAMGWFEIETLTEPTTIKNLASVETGGKAYRIMNDADETGHEYYILENIQHGGWNSYIGSRKGGYAHGLMITHVNYDATAFDVSNNSVNNVKGKPRMTVLPASGFLVSSLKHNDFDDYLSACLYPHNEKSMDFLYSLTSYPNPIVYTGDAETMAATKPVLNISEDVEAKTVSFTFIRDPESGDGVETAIIPEELNSLPREGRVRDSFTLMGTEAPADYRGIVIKNGKKVIMK
ncbi:MAG: M6 family metalloprotease domain-containing protein [Bacteroidales bacterium]|nr:M6 family metalloprotease domain-containing protein [Bacteroidales bacterium]